MINPQASAVSGPTPGCAAASPRVVFFFCFFTRLALISAGSNPQLET